MWIPGNCEFPGNLTSRKLWFPKNCDFLGNITSTEIWQPGKYDIPEIITLPGIVNPWEIWLPGKCEIPGNMTSGIVNSQKIVLPKIWLPRNVTTREILLPWERILSVKVASHTKQITGNSDFIGKCEKKCIMQIFGHEYMWHLRKVWPWVRVTSVTACDMFNHMWQGTAQILTTLATSPQVH